jgi:two-component system, OmpR family, osmolarity sensor histidine kinase EnvZ
MATTNHTAYPDATIPAPLQPNKTQREASKRMRLNLFWRTFFLLGLLLVVSILAWLKTLHELEFEPRHLDKAQLLASLVNISRTALLHTDPASRATLLEQLAEQEGVRVLARLPEDHFIALPSSTMNQRLQQAMSQRLGRSALLAGSVNGEAGLWVGFQVGREPKWLHMDSARLTTERSKTWLLWLLTAGVLSLAGAAAIARLINQPLKQLSYAANKVQDGDFAASHLDEEAVTDEIREVNIGFNRMAEKLAKTRARPRRDVGRYLARLAYPAGTLAARNRNECLRRGSARAYGGRHRATGCHHRQIFDYARPDHVKLRPVNLQAVVASCVYAVQNHRELQITMTVPEDLNVLADEVELARIISNLLENARRYGKTPDSAGVTHVDVAAKGNENWVLIKVRDHGPGVPAEQLANLTKPFFGVIWHAPLPQALG